MCYQLNKLLVFVLLICSNAILAQESLEPLRTNSALIHQHKFNRSDAVENNDIIYLLDTIDIPIIDDFSTNKFKTYLSDTTANNMSDSSWYALYDTLGNVLSIYDSYMSNPTYSFAFDSVNINGVDTLIETATKNDSVVLIVKDLNFYPIVMDTLVVWPNYMEVDSLWTNFSPDVTLIYQQADYEQDSLKLYFASPSADDFDKIWIDQDVFLNDNYAINPWTIGIATFDGLNEAGYPHDWTISGTSDWADQLTSKPIDLSQKGVGDSLYLSFYYQAGGRGDAPELDDSLVLELYLPSNGTWQSFWGINGFTSDEWYYQHLLLDEPAYFQNGFQFRFRSYGALTGSLDHWNLDYVYLNESRSLADTSMNDWAFTQPPLSMLDQFTAMPWKHYQQIAQDITLDQLILPSYNSSSSQKLLQPCAMDVFYEGNLETTVPYAASVLNVPPLSYFDMLYSPGSGFEFEPQINDTFVQFDVRFYIATNTTPERLKENDTIYHNQIFENFYAYDDGSAEAAYGLVGQGAELAYRFVLPDGISNDTLRALKMHFSPSVNDASGDPFFIQIWEDSMGMPGNLMYTTDDFNLPVFYYPEYNLGVNGYYEYELPMLVPVSDTFYIGWRQSSADRLNIGFDRNVNRKQDIFYNLGTGFQNTIFDGALMMRPVFTSAMDNVASIPVLENKNYHLKVYPNPANQFVTIEIESNGEVEVFDLHGRRIFSHFISEKFQLNTQYWDNGIYLVQFTAPSGKKSVEKIIIQH